MNASEIHALVLQRLERYGTPIPKRFGPVCSLRPSDCTPSLREDQAAVYVILDRNDRVLYVGQTAHPEQREKRHRMMNRLRRDGRIVFFVTRDRAAARECERAMIAVLNPVQNVEGSQFQWPGEGRGLTLGQLAKLPRRTYAEMLAEIAS